MLSCDHRGGEIEKCNIQETWVNTHGDLVFNTGSAGRFCGISLAILKNVFWSEKLYPKFWMDNQSKFEKIVVQFIIISVPADGLAPNGARPSASTLMANLVSHVYTTTTLKTDTYNYI